ncbi:MAG: PAS domain-containing protein [Chloroflexota bacterium]
MHILLVRSSTDGVSPAASRLVEQAFAPITWIDVTGQFGLSQALEQQAYNAALVYAPLDWIDTAEAVRQITAGGLGKPCVVIAGQGSEELAVRCLKAGASDYLTDQTLERLPEALRNTLQPSVEQQQAAPLDWAAGVWSEALVQALTQAPKTLLALLDRAGTVLAANRALEQQVLPDGSGLVGKPVWALFPGLTTEARQAVLEQVIQGRSPSG